MPKPKRRALKALSYYRERSGSKCGVCLHKGLQMSATTRAHALGAGGTGSQEGDPRGETRRRPISQSLRLPGGTTSTSGLDLVPGGEGHKLIMKLAVRPTGGTAPEAPCRAPCNAPASGGGACRRLSPPKERQRRSRKRHSFLSRTRLRGQIEPWIFFCEIAGGRVTVPRLTIPPRSTPQTSDRARYKCHEVKVREPFTIPHRTVEH